MKYRIGILFLLASLGNISYGMERNIPTLKELSSAVVKDRLVKDMADRLIAEEDKQAILNEINNVTTYGIDVNEFKNAIKEELCAGGFTTNRSI